MPPLPVMRQVVAPIVAGRQLVVAAGAGSMPLGGVNTAFEPEELASATHCLPAAVVSIAAAVFVVLAATMSAALASGVAALVVATCATFVGLSAAAASTPPFYLGQTYPSPYCLS